MQCFCKSFFLFFVVSCVSSHPDTIEEEALEVEKKETLLEPEIKVGAEQLEEYLSIIQDKNVAIVANQTSSVGATHLVDTLLKEGVEILCVFAPEHGFRGDADAGEKVSSTEDAKTGLPIVSLYGKNRKPTPEQLQHIDLVIFDIQDVGARFYTYISTLHLVMEACAEEEVSVLVLDRPNPNGHYVDGPVLKEEFNSFVGMHPIPIVHGMTIGEYARMINGEKWLNQGMQVDLNVIPCKNYDHNTKYSLPVPPSPNLRTDAAIALYPSLCLFEGTIVSEGRGTNFPFEVFGHPDLPQNKYNFSFTPTPSYGAKKPKLLGETCYGLDLSSRGQEGMNQVNISWLISAYNDLPDQSFFINKNNWFDLLAGSDDLRKAIKSGHTEQEIRSSWEKDITDFKKIRAKYLLYD